MGTASDSGQVHASDLSSGILFEFDGDDVDLAFADVFQCVRRKGRDPEGRARLGGRNVTTVEGDKAMFVTANEVINAENIKCGWPMVSVKGSGLPSLDDSVEDADRFVFEKKLVVPGCGD